MTQSVPLVPVAGLIRKPHRSDLAFLPSALEILETPASPVLMWLIVLIMAFTTAALGWSYFCQIDIFAVANGKIRPIEKIKTVEPLESGRVQRIAVADGSHVKAGDVVIELDQTATKAELESASASFAAYRAEALRRSAAVAAAEAQQEDHVPDINWPDAIPQDIRQRELTVLRHDLSALHASLRSIQLQSEEKKAECGRLRATVAAEETLIAMMQERVQIRQSLVTAKAGGSRANVIDALQPYLSEQATLETNKGYLDEAEAALKTAVANEEKTRSGFIGDNAQKLADAERQAADFEQRVNKAAAALDHMRLTSPIDGTVQSLAITSVMQVVSPGQQLMRIIPDNSPLVVEAYLNNRDFGFVREGQAVIVKVEAIPFTRYGTVSGRVEWVGRDSVPAAEALRTQSDPTQTAPNRPASATATDATQDLVYPVVISLSNAALLADGRLVPLTTGMTVTAEIQTGSRRILDYLFSPLVEASSEAMRER
jgi:hemolysin D